MSGLRVVVTGATGGPGTAAVRTLYDAGATVLAVGSDAGRLDARTGRWARGYVADLADYPATLDLAERVRADGGPVDGLIHLVGGWRGGRGLTGQSDEDWDFLHSRILTTLRNTSRAFYDDLAASASGRLAIVSADAVDSPTAGGANYAAAKAAAESWMKSVAHGFGSVPGSTAAAVTFVVRSFTAEDGNGTGSAGSTDPEAFGTAVAALFQTAGADLNGRRIRLARNGTTAADERQNG